MNRRHLVAFVILTFAVSWGIPGAVLLASRLIETVTFSLAMYSPLYYVGVWGWWNGRATGAFRRHRPRWGSGSRSTPHTNKEA